MSTVVLAMSGGVDSSVAAHLLQVAGHEVVGVFMRHGAPVPPSESCGAPQLLPIVTAPTDPQFHKQGCCTAEDAEDARMVADRLGIDFYALNLQQDFDRIMDYFTEEYVAGRTPNPCVMCNHWIKFGKLFAYADSIGAEYVATGHYARLVSGNEATWLCRGVDAAKDQSYVLFGIDRRLLPRMMLPVGEYQKPEIRKLAEEIGLDVAKKKDSQEICFVSPGKHAEFVASRTPIETQGEIVTADGTVVGEHDGIEKFTIGQRKGLGVAFGQPYYVTKIEADTRRVTVGPHGELARSSLTAKDSNWFVDVDNECSCRAQIRYNGQPHPASVRLQEGGRFEVQFAQPCFGVAPGQAVVCYDEDRVLGGGWIE